MADSCLLEHLTLTTVILDDPPRGPGPEDLCWHVACLQILDRELAIITTAEVIDVAFSKAHQQQVFFEVFFVVRVPSLSAVEQSDGLRVERSTNIRRHRATGKPRCIGVLRRCRCLILEQEMREFKDCANRILIKQHSTIKMLKVEQEGSQAWKVLKVVATAATKVKGLTLRMPLEVMGTYGVALQGLHAALEAGGDTATVDKSRSTIDPGSTAIQAATKRT